MEVKTIHNLQLTSYSIFLKKIEKIAHKERDDTIGKYRFYLTYEVMVRNSSAKAYYQKIQLQRGTPMW